MKSGTTSLHHYLNSHPDIFMCEPKEPQYFVDTPHRPKALEWYLGLFEGAGKERYLGESSTFYTMIPQFTGTAEKIHAFNPDARLLYIMRDPVDRIVSHYWHMVRQVEEWRPFAQVLEEDGTYLAITDYAMQMRPYLDLFGHERVMTLTFEEMTANPLSSVNAIFEWLGLPPLDSLSLAGQAFNARPESLRGPRGAAILHRVRRSGWWDRVAPFCPSPIRKLGRRITERRVQPNEYDFGEVIAALRPTLAERVADLSALLGRDFPEWSRTLDGAVGRRAAG